MPQSESHYDLGDGRITGEPRLSAEFHSLHPIGSFRGDNLLSTAHCTRLCGSSARMLLGGRECNKSRKREKKINMGGDRCDVWLRSRWVEAEELSLRVSCLPWKVTWLVIHGLPSQPSCQGLALVLSGVLSWLGEVELYCRHFHGCSILNMGACRYAGSIIVGGICSKSISTQA